MFFSLVWTRPNSYKMNNLFCSWRRGYANLKFHLDATVLVRPLQLQGNVVRCHIAHQVLRQAKVNDILDVRNGDGWLGDVGRQYDLAHSELIPENHLRVFNWNSKLGENKKKLLFYSSYHEHFPKRFLVLTGTRLPVDFPYLAWLNTWQMTSGTF